MIYHTRRFITNTHNGLHETIASPECEPLATSSYPNDRLLLEKDTTTLTLGGTTNMPTFDIILRPIPTNGIQLGPLDRNIKTINVIFANYMDISDGIALNIVALTVPRPAATNLRIVLNVPAATTPTTTVDQCMFESILQAIMKLFELNLEQAKELLIAQ